MVVIAEHRDDRHRQVGELGAEQVGFGEAAALGQIACQQQHIGVLGDPQQVRSKAPGHGGTQVRVRDGGDPDTWLRDIGWHGARQPHPRQGVNRNLPFIGPPSTGELSE
ncbi:hypothetical protein GCM10009764_10740 [Nocardia ninae]|uniref:Uncharacterized protein n=1 Tax=Nocardia ninae NBRC 108245 TaxID=1210091 RepID=A0A511MTJ5_9NOCA|nr:hypothetical protein NN4_84130 [Nocardia ninae NBRC 108245]